MIKKNSSLGVDYSLLQLRDVQHVYLTALPQSGENFLEQLRDVLETVRTVMDEYGAGESIVEQTVFVSDIRNMDVCRREVEAFFADDMPATTYVPQAPCENKLVAIAALSVGRVGEPVEIERRSAHLVISRHDGVAWCHCSDIAASESNGSLHSTSLDTFGRMAGMLEEGGFRFSQVLRTWLYLGDIVGLEAKRQRYQELNRARADYFANIPFANGNTPPHNGNGAFYPASTGIGALGTGVAMSCVALLSKRDDLRVVPLENPHQTSACEYAEAYSPRRPRFSRAVAVVDHEVATVFVSGTASITGSESCYLDDVEMQTHQTLDNIEALIGRTNLRSHGIQGIGATLGDLVQIRVYLKDASDYEKVLAVCRERIGEVPAIFTVADVCRSELLVEIEGVAISTRPAGAEQRLRHR